MLQPAAASDLWPLGIMRRRAGEARPPVPVVRPRSWSEVQEALSSHGRLVPRGGGSGICGAVSPAAGDTVLDLSALTGCDIDAQNLLVRAEAGVRLADLEGRLSERGLTLGHFPASLPVATVGGLISTLSSGQASSYYGSIEDMLAGLSVALADGSVLRSRQPQRAATGPPLHQLFCGAEGGLGVVLEAVLRVHRVPDTILGDLNQFGNLVTRGPTDPNFPSLPGRITAINQTFINLGKVHIEGLDIEAHYAWPRASYGRVRFDITVEPSGPVPEFLVRRASNFGPTPGGNAAPSTIFGLAVIGRSAA